MRFEALRRVVLLVLLCAVVGCGGEAPPGERTLAGLVDAERFTVEGDADADRALRLPATPRPERVRIDDETRPSVLLPEGAWSWRARVPEGGRLVAGVAVVDEKAGPSPALEATVTLVRGAEREVLEVARGGRADETGTARWLDFEVDLSAWAGTDVVLEIAARRIGPADPGRLAWAPVVVAGPARERADERPNVIFLVVDTLRHDHLTSYGYERDTAPEIDRRLAGRGVVMERAYSQAPWTLPSVTSYLTGRYPGEILGQDPATFGIPAEVPSLAQVFADLGFRTAGFIANPALHEGNGFSRGFETFHSPEGMGALELHADSINRRAVPWLRAHQEEPFFLYVHYIDPHDPYWNPDLVDGRSPWFDDPGGISGRWVHGVYTGRLPVDDLDRTIEHFTALYDSEIRYVDRAIGELLDALPEDVLEDTLVVLTSDHGEELYDHGGWKHGHTLYEDQIHVPLIFRWDRRIPAGRRLEETVRLIDVAPTLLAAVGAEPPRAWQGENLLPALLGDAPVPRLAAYAEDLQVGPLRAAVVADGEKLVLFNQSEPFEPANGLQRHIYELDQARLATVELYDLAADPGERSNLAADGGAEAPAARRMERLGAVLYHRLDRTLPGVRVLTDGVPSGSRLVGELVFENAPTAVVPLFLEPEDRVAVDGPRVRFEISGGPVEKGFRFTDDVGALLDAAAELDGAPLPAGRIRLGEGRSFGGRRVPASALAADALPPPGRAPGLRIWSPAGAVSIEAEASAETLERLKALGYVE